MDYFKLNKYQTPLTLELQQSIPKEVWEDLLEFINSIKFIQRLIAPEEERGYAKNRIKYSELPKDDPRRTYTDNRVVVDIVNPHILEGMDFFRERAIFFEKNKCYTHLRPNPNPRSEYADFWREEKRRWKEGLVRSSDGEWISGYYYFYLNYVQIWLNETTNKDNNKIKKKATRLRKFPKPWLGDYLFFHYIDQAIENGKHAKLLKTRGVGFSFKTAAMSPCNMYVQPGLPNFHLASSKDYLEGEKGVYSKVLDVLDWIGTETPLPRMRLVNRPGDMEVQLGYQDEYGRRRGNKASVYGISLKDNPEKARGVRGPLIHYEEDGLFKDLETAWNVNLKAVEDGNNIAGLMFAGGTGGSKGANFIGSEKLFRNPRGYHIYGIPNVFDKNQDGNTECGFFWGAYLNRALCYDEVEGEPDVIKALLEVLVDRYEVKYNSSDPLAITQKKAEEPITPAEAVMQTSGTIFPVSDLKEYYADIKVQGVRFWDRHYVGDLVLDKENIKWQLADKYPIRSYQFTGNTDGAIEIFEMPKLGADKLPMKGRYISGIDPYDDDSGTSLGSIFIFDMFTDTIVAEYTGRPKFANDFYETCKRMLLFYDARAMYENNKKGLFTYFSQQGCTYLLAENPKILKDQDMMRKGNYGNKQMGVHATAEINSFARSKQKDWMLTVAHPNYQDTDEQGNIITSKLNLQLIRSMGYLEEAIAWNSDGNFDRISSLGMCMILREEKKQFVDGIMNQNSPTKDIVNNDYFLKNYDNKYKNFSHTEIEKLTDRYFPKS